MNAECDVPGCVMSKQGEYMTVNLSLIVGHIHKIGKRLFGEMRWWVKCWGVWRGSSVMRIDNFN